MEKKALTDEPMYYANPWHRTTGKVQLSKVKTATCQSHVPKSYSQIYSVLKQLDYDATTLGMSMQIHQPHKIRHRVHPKSNMTTAQVFCKVLESLV